MKLLVHLPRPVVGDVLFAEEPDDFVFTEDHHQRGTNTGGGPECKPG